MIRDTDKIPTGVPLKDNGNWERNPYAVVLERDFVTAKDYLSWASEVENKEVTKLFNDYMDELPNWLLSANFNNSSIGGNDALNPYWSFNEDDDIIPPLNKGGMGRVYSEIYDQTQQILWLQFGIPEYSGMKNFFLGKNITQLAGLMGGKSLSWKLGNLLGSGIGLAIKLPILPFIWAKKIIDLGMVEQTTKYVGFRNYMPVYYRMVNTIMSHLAVGMKLYTAIPTSKQKRSQAEKNFNAQLPDAGMPSILKHGPDIFTILDKRARIVDSNSAGVQTTDNLTDELNDESWTKRVSGAFTRSALGASDFIGFRIEKSLDSSENFTSTTGASSLANKLNGNVDSAKDRIFSTMAGKTGVSIIDSVINFTVGTAQGLAESLGIDKLLTSVTGAGYFTIPDTWKGSSYSQSYSVNIKLRSRYGDPVSIYQSIYVPLACLLAGSMPRSISSDMYTSPFIVRAYCKGMFAVPLGMIENLTVKRGLPEFGWSDMDLPTAVDVSMTIKDLSPTMHLTIADDKFLSIFSHNDNLQEYLTTLSGIGLRERNSALQTYIKKTNACLLIHKNTTGNPIYWGIRLGHSNIAKFTTSFIPYSAISNN